MFRNAIFCNQRKMKKFEAKWFAALVCAATYHFACCLFAIHCCDAFKFLALKNQNKSKSNKTKLKKNSDRGDCEWGEREGIEDSSY